MIQTKKRVVITGISSGFGLICAEKLALRGHEMIAIVRGGAGRIQSLASPELTRALAVGTLTCIDADLEKDSANLGELVRQAVGRRWGGSLDALINNAGFGVFGPATDIPVAEVRRQFEVNFFAPVALSNALATGLRQARGSIIQISSIAGRVTLPFYGIYCASKYALEAYSEALYYELSAAGVRVHLIEPGGFKTKFVQNVSHLGGSNHPGFQKFEDFHKKKTARVGGDPARVADRIVNLVEGPTGRLRFPMGIDGKLANLLLRILPDGVRVFLTRYLFRPYL